MVRYSGAEIDGYEVVDGKWRHRETGAPLAPHQTVTLRTAGGPVFAVNPITMQATSVPQIFLVTAVDGVSVSFSPFHK